MSNIFPHLPHKNVKSLSYQHKSPVENDYLKVLSDDVLPKIQILSLKKNNSNNPMHGQLWATRTINGLFCSFAFPSLLLLGAFIVLMYMFHHGLSNNCLIISLLVTSPLFYIILNFKPGTQDNIDNFINDHP